jgi:DNA-binding transcriptional LysR family regulator
LLGRGRSKKLETVSVAGPVRINNPDAVCGLAEAGLGIALVPDFVARDAIARGTLHEVLSGRVAFEWTILAVFPRKKRLPARARADVEHLAAKIGH